MAAHVQTQEIAPAHGRRELRGVVSAAVVILLAWAGGIAARQLKPGSPPLASHQQPAFTGLSALDQGLFNDLRSAAAEIRALQAQHQAWPEPAALAADAIPPFVADAVSKQRGGLAWRRMDAHAPTHAVYWGSNDTVEWALVLSGESTAVWRRPAKPDGAIPQAIPDLLVLDGWTEFVPRHATSP